MHLYVRWLPPKGCASKISIKFRKNIEVLLAFLKPGRMGWMTGDSLSKGYLYTPDVSGLG